MRELVEIKRPTRCIVHFKQDEEVASRMPARIIRYQVVIGDNQYSPSGHFIRFNSDSGNEIHGWVAVQDIIIDEELEELVTQEELKARIDKVRKENSEFQGDSEQYVLGALMLDSSRFEEVSERLRQDDFHASQHKAIFSAMRACARLKKTFDVVSIGEMLELDDRLDEAGGIDYLGELCGNARGTEKLMQHADVISERQTLRNLISTAYEIAEKYPVKENTQR